mgnify:CR=1 FL=1
MKKWFQIFTMCLCGLLVPVAPMAILTMTSGCATQSPQEAAQKSLGTLEKTKDLALTAWGKYVAQQKQLIASTPEQTAKAQLQLTLDSNREAVESARAKYAAAFHTAWDLANYDYSAFAPQDAVRLLSELINTINVIAPGTVK